MTKTAEEIARELVHRWVHIPAACGMVKDTKNLSDAITAALKELEKERDEARERVRECVRAAEPALVDGVWSGTVPDAIRATADRAEAAEARVDTLERALALRDTFRSGEEVGLLTHAGYCLDLAIKHEAAARAAKSRLAILERALGFFASVIKSGEPWTVTCQREYDAAISASRSDRNDRG